MCICMHCCRWAVPSGELLSVYAPSFEHVQVLSPLSFLPSSVLHIVIETLRALHFYENVAVEKHICGCARRARRLSTWQGDARPTKKWARSARSAGAPPAAFSLLAAWSADPSYLSHHINCLDSMHLRTGDLCGNLGLCTAGAWFMCTMWRRRCCSARSLATARRSPPSPSPRRRCEFVR
eukprot:COSAG05_NODE_2586_length_2871_cov_21.775758_3_plen_180_part_00